MSASENEPFLANADLDTFQYTILVNSTGVRVNRNFTAGTLSAGVLQNKPKSGEHATVAVRGRSRCFAGGTITAGAQITNNLSGTAVVVASGDYAIGTSRSAVASGSLFDLEINHSGYKGQ